jgi:diguanylate cyclase (GGDEF)-like protein
MPSLMGLRPALEILVAAAACAGWLAHRRARRSLVEERQQREAITCLQVAAIEALLPPDPRRRRRCAMAAELGRLMRISPIDATALLATVLLRDADAGRLIRGSLSAQLDSLVRPVRPEVEATSTSPLPARILAVLEAFDSPQRTLAGRVPPDRQEIVDRIRSAAGVSLDPDVVRVFVSDLDRLESLGKNAEREPAGSGDPTRTPQAVLVRGEADPPSRLADARLQFGSFDQEIEKALRDGAPLSLVELDINGFSVINERFGRHAGDRVLRGVARAIRSQLRPGDTCVRYTSDQFLVSVPGVGAAGIDALKARIELAIGRHKFVVARGQSVRIGISIGAASFPDDGQGYDALIAAAGARRLRQKTSLRSGSAHPILMLRYAGRSNVPVN